MDLANKRVLVVGLGKSGVASALFLQARGAKVTVSDAKPQDQLGEEIPVLLDHGIAVETGGHGERTFRGQDLIVVSPGVPVDSPSLVQARALGEPVIGEIELASQYLPKNIVAITGSNGKTTTTTLAGEIVAAGGFATAVGGNIGTPAISLVQLRNLKPSWSWRCRVSSWRRSRRFARELQSCSTSRPTTSTVTAPSTRTRMPRRASLRISSPKISRS